MLFVDVLSEADAGWLLDPIFDIVINVIRRQCGMGFADVDLMLADARRQAEDIFGKELDGLVDLDAAIEAIADHLADGHAAS